MGGKRPQPKAYSYSLSQDGLSTPTLMHIVIPTLATLTSKCAKNSLPGYQLTVVPFHMTVGLLMCQVIPVLATLTTKSAKNSLLGIQVTVIPFRTTIWMQSDGIQCPFVCNNFEFPI